MDIPALIETYGLPGIIMVGLGYAVVALWNRLALAQDARLNDLREHGKELRAVSDSATAAINGLTRVLEDRRNG